MRRPGLLLACGALVLVTGCATDGSSTAEAPSASTVVADLGPSPHDVTAPVVGGGTLSLVDYRSAPLALWFWAPT